MQYVIRHRPSFALLEVSLMADETMLAEPGAIVTMTGNIDLVSRINAPRGQTGWGRRLTALGRAAFGGETFYITAITATGAPGEVSVAPTLPGDIMGIPLVLRPLMIQAGSYLASSPGLDIQIQWLGLSAFLGGESLVFLRAMGQGTVFISSFGGIFERQVPAGEHFIVGTGHLVAFEEGMQFEPRWATRQQSGSFWERAFASFTTGEGVVMDFLGPGRVWVQTREPGAFIDWIDDKLPEPPEPDCPDETHQEIQ